MNAPLNSNCVDEELNGERRGVKNRNVEVKDKTRVERDGVEERLRLSYLQRFDCVFHSKE